MVKAYRPQLDSSLLQEFMFNDITYAAKCSSKTSLTSLAQIQAVAIRSVETRYTKYPTIKATDIDFDDPKFEAALPMHRFSPHKLSHQEVGVDVGKFFQSILTHVMS